MRTFVASFAEDDDAGAFDSTEELELQRDLKRVSHKKLLLVTLGRVLQLLTDGSIKDRLIIEEIESRVDNSCGKED